jgi:hypothetical protein
LHGQEVIMVKVWRTARGALFGAGLVVLAVGVGVATGAIPSANGVIHACHKTAPGEETLRVIDTEGGHQCKEGETALAWNQQGPQGPQGPPGPAGPAGTSGLTTQVVTQSVSGGQYAGTRSGSVSCPSGSRVTGGGYSAPYGGSQQVVENRPSGNGWYVQVLSTGSITVYAVCAHLS